MNKYTELTALYHQNLWLAFLRSERTREKQKHVVSTRCIHRSETTRSEVLIIPLKGPFPRIPIECPFTVSNPPRKPHPEKKLFVSPINSYPPPQELGVPLGVTLLSFSPLRPNLLFNVPGPFPGVPVELPASAAANALRTLTLPLPILTTCSPPLP